MPRDVMNTMLLGAYPSADPITRTTTDSAARFFSFSFFSNSSSMRDQSICRMSSPWEYAPIEFIALLSRITQSGHWFNRSSASHVFRLHLNRVPSIYASPPLAVLTICTEPS